jgi:hypothetical protein
MKSVNLFLPKGLKPSRIRNVGISIAVALGAALMPISTASAHHGWPGFQTDRLVYIAGTVSSDGVWGNPHSQFDVTLDSNLPADTPELAIPEQLSHAEDSVRVNAALAYGGPHKKLEVIIAPPAWSGRWGLDRALKVGERFQAVGYINRTDDGLFRPVVFWYGADAVPVSKDRDRRRAADRGADRASKTAAIAGSRWSPTRQKQSS